MDTSPYPQHANGSLTTVAYGFAMTKQQVVATVDRWLDRSIPALIAAAIMGGFIVWADVRVIKEKVIVFATDMRSVETVNASQNADIQNLRERLLLLEVRNGGAQPEE